MTGRVQWKDLCLDALDREVMASFWAAATGLDPVVSARHVSLDGPSDAHRIWVNGVDRPHTVKNRVHLDVDCASVEDLVALGARVLEPAEQTGLGWTVLADPEGNEFCAFVRAPDAVPAYRLHGVVVDCTDPERLAAWWGERFGVEVTAWEGHDVWTLEGAGPDDRLTLDFVPVPEPRSAPNRVHWDLTGDPDAVVAAGATDLWATEHWRVLADPEGNEFCVFA